MHNLRPDPIDARNLNVDTAATNNDGFYVGLVDVWENCCDAGNEFLVVAAEPPHGADTVMLQVLEATAPEPRHGPTP